MTSPIQIPYLRPDPIHELPGGLGALGHDLVGLAGMLQARQHQQELVQETQQRLDIERQRAKTEADYKDIEGQRVQAATKELQHRTEVETEDRQNFTAALAKLPPNVQDYVRILHGLGRLPESAQEAVSQAVAPKVGMQPRMALSMGKFLSLGMKLGDAAKIMNFDLPEGVEANWRYKTPTALLGESRLESANLYKNWQALDKQISEKDKAFQEFVQTWQKAHGPGMEELSLPDDKRAAAQAARDLALKKALDGYRSQVAPNYSSWIQQRELVRQRMLKGVDLQQQAQSLTQQSAPGQGDGLEQQVNDIMSLMEKK